MAVHNVDPNAKESKTGTAPFGGLSGNAPKAADRSSKQSNVKTEGKANLNPAQPAYPRTDKETPEAQDQAFHLGPDVGSIPAPKGNVPSLHELAVQTVKERGGVNAEEQPTFDDQVKQVEEEMNSHVNRTTGV
jgi:hypothetical protein